MRPEEANHCLPMAERTFPPRRLLDSHRRMSTPWDEWRLWASVEPEMPPPTTRQSYRCPSSRHGDHLWVSTTVAPMLLAPSIINTDCRRGRGAAPVGGRPRMLWRPVMAEEDDEGGGRQRRRRRGGDYGGNKQRQGLVPAHLCSVPL
jgi:hypothetical protein